jgi:hypothetical protein
MKCARNEACNCRHTGLGMARAAGRSASATELFAVRRGELVCVYQSCPPGLDWFESDEPPTRYDLDRYLGLPSGGGPSSWWEVCHVPLLRMSGDAAVA